MNNWLGRYLIEVRGLFSKNHKQSSRRECGLDDITPPMSKCKRI